MPGKGTGKRRTRTRGSLIWGHGFFHNGRMAWAMPCGVGLRYLHGDYIRPPGWEVSLVLNRPWERGHDGYIRRQNIHRGKAKHG